MISARASKLKGGGGILRRKDGTILGLNFTTENPLFAGKPAPKRKPGDPKPSDFVWLYGVLDIQEDGREDITHQPLKVGGVDDFEVVLDGAGLSGTVGISKSSEFGIFLNSLSNPLDEGDGFDEEQFPEDPEGLVADFSPMVGARVQFDWIPDESKWGKANPRKAKDKDTGKPIMKDGKQVTYPRENLAVRSYYGQVDVAALAKAAKTAKAGGKAPVAGKPVKAAAASTGVDIADLASTKVVECLKAAKGNSLTKAKLSVKLLTALAGDNENREDVRTWALKGENLASINANYAPDGFDEVAYDAATETVSLVAE